MLTYVYKPVQESNESSIFGFDVKCFNKYTQFKP